MAKSNVKEITPVSSGKKAAVKSASSSIKKTAVKKTVVKATVPVAVETKKVAVAVGTPRAVKTVSMKMVDLMGKDAGSLHVPSDIFAAEVNNALIAQAIRVFLANQREGSASTKSRGEVRGSTRKIYRQKGTGRARHGGIRAPIFVGGGIAFGPKPKDYSLKLSKKMKKNALFSALSVKRADNAITIVAGSEKLEAKTKEAAKLLATLSLTDKPEVLFVVSEGADNVRKAARNLSNVVLLPYAQLNTYDVMHAHALVFMQEAASKMAGHFLKGDK